MKSTDCKENPIINSDFPDPDIIRVGDTYYMVSTTMHFMPGCDILRSFDLMNWELLTHVYDFLEDTPKERLEGKENAYGQGMWAPSIRYNEGKYYITFTANDTKKTYLYIAKNILGPWQKHNIDAFYHDNSLFFDDDGKVFIVYGNKTIFLTELKNDLSGPKEGGLHRIIAKDEELIHLGYEGCHLYKYNGIYYLFCCHILSYGSEMKSQVCFISDSLNGEFKGKCIIDDDCGYHKLGVAQGGIVDTPEGDWYAFMFQDRGAIGRCPVIMPMKFENGFPVVGVGGKVPKIVSIPSTRPGHIYSALSGSDNFIYKPDENGKIHLKKFWQFNHMPVPELWSVQERIGAFRLKSSKICTNIMQAYNTLTQRTMGPVSSAYVVLDGSKMKEHDFAGICAFQGCYGALALTKDDDKYYLSMLGKEAKDSSIFGEPDYESPGYEYERIPIKNYIVKLKVSVDFTDKIDTAEFFYWDEHEWKKVGITHRLFFKMDHFTGCRFGLYYYSTKVAGGYVDFMKFNIKVRC